MTREELNVIADYGLKVSALFDPRYYDEQTILKAGACPQTCPEKIRDLLIKQYGENWISEFWGSNFQKEEPNLV